jgi:hypothetical protein
MAEHLKENLNHIRNIVHNRKTHSFSMPKPMCSTEPYVVQKVLPLWLACPG